MDNDVQYIRITPPQPADVLRYAWIGIAAVILVVLGFSSYYVVPTDSKGVVQRFGRFDRITEPGLHFKLPLIETVSKPQVERIFKEREIARNEFVVAGHKVDMSKITSVAVKTVEGEQDDISAPGQCLAALDLLTGLPAEKKAAHVEPGAGHYGIFAGKS